jgi:hypothetical protein
MDAKYSPDITSAYCREVCKVRCDKCPAPNLLPEVQAAAGAYIQCSTQWRTAFAGRSGLDYPACIQILKLHRRHWRREIPDDPIVTTPLAELMQDIQIIEAASLQADSDRRDAEEKSGNK